MNRKNHAAIALLAWLGVTGWLASMVVAKPAVLRLHGQQEDSQTVIDLRNGMARNERDMGLLGAFDDLPFSGDDGQSLVAVVPAPRPGADDAAPSYEISLVVTHGKRRRALINGQYLAPGSRLDDGTRVVAIGNDWVRLDDPAYGVRTLHVRNPLDEPPPSSTPPGVRQP